MCGNAAIRIRPAEPSDAGALTALTIRSKRHWGYTDAEIDLWRDDLSFTAESIAGQTVLVAEAAGTSTPIGVMAVRLVGRTAELEDLWIDPDWMGRGLGRRLFYAALDLALAAGSEKLSVVSDPNAEGFYLRMGARRVDLVPSRPVGRVLPRLEIAVHRSECG